MVETHTQNHPDGRKDVTIQVNTLNVDENTPEGKKAKEVIENEIIPALANKRVLTVVVHKPSNISTSQTVKLPQVKQYARAAIANFPQPEEGRPVDVADFVIVEVNIDDSNLVRVSTIDTL